MSENQRPTINLAGLAEIPVEEGKSGVFITGSAGTGKTTLIMDILDQAHDAGAKCVIYDPNGEYTSKYYREGVDVLLCPHDRRSAKWAVFKDVACDQDYDLVIENLTPRETLSDEYWCKAERMILEDVFRIVSTYPDASRNLSTVQQIILKSSDKELAALLSKHGAPAYELFDDNMAGCSARRLLSDRDSIRQLHHLSAAAGDGFSIAEWVSRDDDSCLFITSRPELHPSIKPFAELWLSLAVQALCDTPAAGKKRPLLLFIDDIDGLDISETLQNAGTKVYTVAGMRNPASNIILANALAGQAGVKIAFRAVHYEYADWIANSLMPKNTILPDEVLALKDMEYFVHVPGHADVPRMELQYRAREKIAPAFAPRE